MSFETYVQVINGIYSMFAVDNTAQQVAIWRPRAPPGYLILGDCATSG